jgi:serine/threonine protein kinase
VTKGEVEEALPRRFGRYTLVERLAAGGMAEVFKAKILSHHGFEKLLVIKRILPHLAKDKNFVSMFIDEAKLTAQLSHPKIVQVTDFGDVDGQYFIALEYVDGFDALALLRTSAQKQVRLPIPISVFIVMELLDALDSAHNAADRSGKGMRLVHRDISPSNVFISRRGDVKLGDFGIAHAQERESKTQAGTLKGKYGYMSPEQVVGAKLDGRSDLFAVGIVLAEMLMGRRLFTAPTDLDVLLMVRDGRLERLDKYCKDLPQDLDRITRTALKKRLGDRYQTAAAFRDDLGDFLFRLGFRVRSSDIGAIANDYFDPTPEGLARLKENVKKWDVTPERRARVSSGAGRTTSSDGTVTTTPAQPRKIPDKVDSVSTPVTGRNRAPTVTPQVPPPKSHPEVPATTAAEDMDVVIDDDIGEIAISMGGPSSRPSSGAASMKGLDTLNRALEKPLALVDLDRYETPNPTPGPLLRGPGDTGPLPYNAPPPSHGNAPSGPYHPGSSGAINLGTPFGSPFPTPPPTSPGAFPSGPATDLSREIATGARQPDKAGDVSILSPMRVFADLAATGETGLLRFELAPHVKEVYLVRGAPESINSSLKSERFGEYLVSRGFLTQSNLDAAVASLPRFSGKLGDTLVGMGLMRPLDVFRLLSQQVRERVMEIFAWVQGYFSFYRGMRNPQEAFPLGLDTFEILGAGLLTLPFEFLERRFGPLLDYRPRVNPYGRIQPEAFRLGPTPREVLSFLDGSRTLREWMARFTTPSELLTFLRTLYLLLESDLAVFE